MDVQPVAEGIDDVRLEALSAAVSRGQYGLIDAIVIVRNGRVCFDGYFNGTPYDLHEMQSVEYLQTERRKQ